MNVTVRKNYVQQIEIRIKGQIDNSWSDWLEGLILTHTVEGETILSGMVRDQSALYGVLNRLFGLGLQLISFTSTGQNQEKPPQSR